jgi:hypothetical protein
MSNGGDGLLARVYGWLLAHRAAGAGVLAALTVALGASAARVRPDHSLEQLFPVGDSARAAYDRYKRAFPGEDARAVVIVSAPDLFTPAGLAAISALERDVGALRGVIHVIGPTSVDRIAAGPFGPARERLFSPGLPPDEVARRRADAEVDPLLAWNVFTRVGPPCRSSPTSSRACRSDAGGRRSWPTPRRCSRGTRAQTSASSSPACRPCGRGSPRSSPRISAGSFRSRSCSCSRSSSPRSAARRRRSARSPRFSSRSCGRTACSARSGGRSGC